MKQILEKIVNLGKITVDDEIYFEKISDVISKLFTDVEGNSQLIKGYDLDETHRIWCLNVDLNYNLEEKLATGYYNWIDNDSNYIFQYNTQKDFQKRIKETEKLKEKNLQFIVFKQVIDGSKKFGYKFFGIFIYDDKQDANLQTIIYKKISNEFNYNFKNKNCNS